MQAFFKYKFGYVNIDSENLYFTNSGNWSETTGMQEKGIQKQNNSKQTRISYFFTFLFSILFLITIVDLSIERMAVSIPIAILSFSAYRYLSSELGEQFKLPISKISNVEVLDSEVTLSFINGNEESEFIEIAGVDEKGLDLMRVVKTYVNYSGNFSTNQTNHKSKQN